ncbi:cyclic beta 1-2 glucan synthetase [Acidobacterium capsulatum ATCC 51196]|uniref:Cyclic beta 1-2 glucan synthetase n=1 Tax=Acidobacterium capsulatum (strain ATCC 51196 / DSM 11244 / BCRC 80197 / JCM 7670 / NBRC 15755 / NCIMB 13165 / 161) TaxID=240015 RepID=C1F339_ACIC5|nr:cyclic beta 1-2 glucan synthetase [Acidobacterium capsulatum ATCC 51196]
MQRCLKCRPPATGEDMTQPVNRFEYESSAEVQHLRDAVRIAAGWDVVHRPEGPEGISARMDAVRRQLEEVEKQLNRWNQSQTVNDEPAVPHHVALLEILRNSRLLRSVLKEIRGRVRQIALLPRVVMPAQREEPRMARAAELYLHAVHSVYSPTTFCVFLEELQKYDPLNIDEFWNTSVFLQFVLLEALLDEASKLLRSPDTVEAPRTETFIKSLREVSQSDWPSLLEPLILCDGTLRQDPAEAYARMDFASRERYRQRVAYLSRHSDCTELQVAHAAIELSRDGALRASGDARMQQRYQHVGFYLLDKGFPDLGRRVGFHPPVMERMRMWVQRNAEDFYIGGVLVLSLLLVGLLILPLVQHAFWFGGLIIALLLLALPASQDGVELMNLAVTTLFSPNRLARMDFSSGIPDSCITLVTVPSLLLNESQVRDLVKDLEIRFLANRDANLHFALLTDLPDSVTAPRGNDSDPLVELAVQLIDGLNTRYASLNRGSFLLLHRHRVFNRRQGVWMGWERKRGKLLELNNLLIEGRDAFPVKAGPVEVLQRVRYILTLDADTQLPFGTAAALVGAMAHPLNQAVIDPDRRIVTEGYGILQPRIGITVRSASRSRLAGIYSGQTGLDIYSRAVSDAYQDLFGEGIFTGKGLYEVATFHTVLNHRFPKNALLSHDLIEGAYARAGLVSDLELIDDYPSHYSAYSRRKHRWVRGDWQIAPWMFARVPDENGHWVANPISSLSGWKIFDNLRRSLVEPFLFLLFLAGWLGLPGDPLYWTLLPAGLLLLPYAAQLLVALIRILQSEVKRGTGDAWAGFARGLSVVILTIAFLPHQMLLSMDAIVRSFVRRWITGEHLLEWETAAQSESSSLRQTPVDRYLVWMPLVAIGLGVLIYFAAANHRAIWYALPVLILWGLSSGLTSWLNRNPREQQQISDGERAYLYLHALRIWRYFHQFGRENHNYLIPDNVEEDGLQEAARVSPTNVGLLLNSRQAACEFGFITVPEFVALTQRSLATIDQMEKYRGHLYNWYDTQTLSPLEAQPFISSVDSGNLLASLYTLRSGAVECLQRPVLRKELLASIDAHWQLMKDEKDARVVNVSPPPRSSDWTDWLHWLPRAEAAFAEAQSSMDHSAGASWWFTEAYRRVLALKSLFTDYFPWLLPQFQPILADLSWSASEDVFDLSVEGAFLLAKELETKIGEELSQEGAQPLQTLAPLQDAVKLACDNLRSVGGGLLRIAQDAERLANAMEFSFLADPNRKILSIGFNVRQSKLLESCYDMLASEARIATFLAIARGDLPYSSWFKLARDFASASGRYLLLSWTGTMFEYMMPALWMRSYPNTLLAQTQESCVRVQQSYGADQGIPWGISESGAAQRNDSGHYHYHAFGLPKIALSMEAKSGPVVSPYSTFLALSRDVSAALRNLGRMEAAGWTGAFGFYESGDFSVSKRKPEIVREWMAHHQGMSLLATLNLLQQNPVQRWFHENALIESAELLLHEMAPSKTQIHAELDTFNSAAG